MLGLGGVARNSLRGYAAALKQPREVSQRRPLRGPPPSPALLDAPHGARTPDTARFASPQGGLCLADAKRGVDGEVAKQQPYCSWAPSEPSSSAGLCGARVSALQPLTSGGCSSAAATGRVASSARPAKPEQRRAVGPRPTGEQGRPFFGDFLLAKQKKVTALSGAHPDAASRSEQAQRQSEPSWIPACTGMTVAVDPGMRRDDEEKAAVIPCVPLSSPTSPAA